MEILSALGKIFGANDMIAITSAQISGVSYKTIGDAGLEYLHDLAEKGAKVKAPSFLNPAGMDRQQWKEMGVPEKFAKKQLEVMDAYSRMGISQTYTCTPYLVGIRPKIGEHVAWSESSAVVFANSVLGARTNREGGPSALAAAICGCTPNYGMHLSENRVASVELCVEAGIKTPSDFGALGCLAGKMAKGKVPAFTGLNGSEDNLKSLGAAMAAAGSVALFFAKGVTPEFALAEGAEKITITQKEIGEQKGRMSIPGAEPQIITVGCPHASLEEIKRIAELVQGKKLKKPVWICTARETKNSAVKAGYAKSIEEAGGRIVADTCMVVCPMEEMGFSCTGCNSGKAANYLPTMNRQKVKFSDIEELL
jgi:predicted aconitase